MIVELTNKASWDTFVQKSPQGNLFSTTYYADAICKVNKWDYKMFVNDTQNIRMGVLVYIGPDKTIQSNVHFTPFTTILFDLDEVSPIGIFDDQNTFITELTAYLEFNGYREIGFVLHPSLYDIRPFQWYNYHGGGFYNVGVRYTSYLPFNLPEDMLKDMHPKSKRYMIRKAEKLNIKIETNNDFNIFKSLYLKTFERQGIKVSDHDMNLMEAIFEASQKYGFGEIVLACIDDKPVAAVFLTWHDREIYYHFAAMDPGYRNTGVGEYLLWNIFLDKMSDFDFIDFVGINSPQRGQFKLAWGGQAFAYYAVKQK